MFYKTEPFATSSFFSLLRLERAARKFTGVQIDLLAYFTSIPRLRGDRFVSRRARRARESYSHETRGLTARGAAGASLR